MSTFYKLSLSREDEPECKVDVEAFYEPEPDSGIRPGGWVVEEVKDSVTGDSIDCMDEELDALAQ